MSTQVAHELGNFFAWRASDDFAIHLSLKVVTQLTTQISRTGNESDPGELRGLLLGRTIDGPVRTTLVEDFELLSPPEYATAEQPDSEDKLFEIACRMAKDKNRNRALGFFISGWDGKLSMAAGDLKTFRRVFGDDGNIALLIQTSRRSNERDAAFFYWQDGQVHPRDFGYGFPFDTGALLGGHPGWRYPDPLDPMAMAAEPPPQEAKLPRWPASHDSHAEQLWEEAASAVEAANGPRIKWSHLAPTIALAIVGIGALQLASTSKHRAAEATQVSEVAAPSATATPAVASPAAENRTASLGLTVTLGPKQLDIHWDRQSPAIVGAESGAMKIVEDGAIRIVPFSQRQLQDGYLAYMPKSKDVSVVLQVTASNGSTTSEAVRWLAAQ